MAVVCVLLGGAVVPSSSLASITFGADLSAPSNTADQCPSGCTVINSALPAGAPPLTSPVTGTIIRWGIKTGAGSTGTVTFRVIAPVTGGKFSGAGTGDTETTPTTATTTTFPTRLPVQAGDYVGVTASVNSVLEAYSFPAPGGSTSFFASLADGSTGSPFAGFPSWELLVNAVVVALPSSSVTTVSACAGNMGQLAASVRSDPDPAVAPKAIHFRIDGGGEQVLATTGNPGGATIPVPSGSHALEYWGEDTVGGLESPHHTTGVLVGCGNTLPTGTSPAAPAAPVTLTTLTTTPPSLSSVSQSHRRWRLGGKLARFAAAAKPPVGTTFGFTLNQPASVRLAFAQLLPGRKVNGKCVAQTARNRSHKACKRSAPRGSLSFIAGAGPHKLFFQGRLTRTSKLKPGIYTLTITATNAASQRASRTLKPFTIISG